MMENGIKFDQDKVRYDLLPIDSIEEIAKVMTFGAKKYSERNWEAGLDYSRLFRASLSHLFAFWQGEDLDEETKLHHLASAGFNVMALLHFQLNPERYLAFDNREEKDKYAEKTS